MRLRFTIAAIATALAALSWIPTIARADEPPPEAREPPRDVARDAKPFGSRGQVALDDLTGFRFALAASSTMPSTVGTTGVVSYFTSTSDAGGQLPSSSRTTIAFNPSIDYFVTDHVSIGGAFGVGYMRSRLAQYDTANQIAYVVDSGFGLGVDPRIGYVFRVADDIVLWPRVGFGYEVTRSSREGDEGTSTLERTLHVQGQLGVIFRAGRHFYVNIGPKIALQKSIYSGTAPLGWHSTATTLGGGANVSLGLLL